MITYQAFQGVISEITDFWAPDRQSMGCTKMYSVIDENNVQVNFVVTPETYVVNQEYLQVGDSVTGFYDKFAPVPLIYPPQYRSLIFAKNQDNQIITVDYFNHLLVNSSNSLKLNIGPDTQILLKNGQPFFGFVGNRNLIVIYEFSTRSIPAQTTPIKIIVLCEA